MDATLRTVLLVAAWLLAGYVAVAYYKAGSFKLTAPIAKLVEAGMSWTKEIPAYLVRVIAILEILGAAGVIFAPAASQIFGWTWANAFAILAAGGLALTMLAGAIMHIVRGEFKYTWKINTQLFLAPLVLTVLFVIAL